MILLTLIISACLSATPDGGSEMATVPAGPFVFGCDKGEQNCSENAQPRRELTLDAFDIDVEPVRQREYEACVAAQKCPRLNLPPLDERNYPVISAPWPAANAYCAFVGKRLPTEAELVKAGRGTDGRKFPWGNEKIGPGQYCSDGTGKWPSDIECPDNVSPYGLRAVGMSSEWTADWFAPTFIGSTNPTGPQRGCHRTQVISFFRRDYQRPDYSTMYESAFRCVRCTSVSATSDPIALPPEKCPERQTDADAFAAEHSRMRGQHAVSFGVGVLALGAIPLSGYIASRAGTPPGRFALDTAGGIALGIPVGLLAGWIALEASKEPAGAGPAMGGMANLFLIALPVGVLTAISAGAFGIGLADRLQTGRWAPGVAFLAGAAGIVVGSAPGYLMMLANESVRRLPTDIATIVLVPITIMAVGAAGFALANQPR